MTIDVGPNLTSVLVALISAIAAIAAAYFAYRGGQKSSAAASTTTATHALVDGRMTELLDLTRASATAAGITQGLQSQAAATDATTVANGTSKP